MKNRSFLGIRVLSLFVFLILVSSVRSFTNRVSLVFAGEGLAFEEFYQRFSGKVNIPNCGTMSLCSYSPRERIPCMEAPPRKDQNLIFQILRHDGTNGFSLTMAQRENLILEKMGDGQERIRYQETRSTSLPPGLGRDVGFRTRFTIEILAESQTVNRLSIFVEDFDPRTKRWLPRFEIDDGWANPLICERFEHRN